MSLFVAENVSFAYDANSKSSSLENINFQLESGCIYDLVGASGSGKSMLLCACAQMMSLRAGALYLDGTPADDFTPQKWRTRVALVPQNASMIPGTVRDNLLLAWTFKVNKDTTPPTSAELSALLELASLDVELDRDAAKLSGGEAARVALLRVLAMRPSVMLLDEVDAALDATSSAKISALTKQMVERGACALRVRHRESDGLAAATFKLANGKLDRVSAGLSDGALADTEPKPRDEREL